MTTSNDDMVPAIELVVGAMHEDMSTIPGYPPIVISALAAEIRQQAHRRPEVVMVRPHELRHRVGVEYVPRWYLIDDLTSGA